MRNQYLGEKVKKIKAQNVKVFKTWMFVRLWPMFPREEGYGGKEISLSHRDKITQAVLSLMK